MIRSPLALLAALVMPAVAGAASTRSIQWSELPPLPDQRGFAGAFVGTHKGSLLVAGGANFPEKPPVGRWREGLA
jgi:N-acetylneuraminic acid mutarotase